jgi:hypothetical protein
MRARNSESFSVSSLSHCLVYDNILLTTLLANSDEDKEANNVNNSEEEENDTDKNEGEEADDDDDSEEENEAIDNTMPPKLKSAAALPPKKKSPPKEPGVENLTTALSKSKLKVATPPPAKKFLLKTDDAYMVKAYTQKNVDFVEVDIHVAGPLPEHVYKVELSPDGTCLISRRLIPDYFFESKRMVAMLGRAYHPDELRVIAHDNVVQQIRKGGDREQWVALCT